jgi:NADP-dependent 3-hydroxy acid dehydrogenase YdfG
MKQSILKDKIIWITGSGRGIGAATAIQLASRGARIVVSARTHDEIAQVAADIKKSKGQSLAIRCDVTCRDDIQTAIREVKTTWGPVDILINNAGLAVFKKIIQTSEQEWDAMMQTNLKSAFLCTQAVLPDMIKKQMGHIINIVSVAGKQPYFSSGAYCASKYGLVGFTDVLRLEMRKYHVHVTAVFPGAVDTAIWNSARADRGKMIKAEDVAHIIAELCESPSTLMLEEVLLRPLGGDL